MTSLEKILLTGVNGLLGQNLVRGLLSSGYDVRGFHRPGRLHRSLEGLGFEKFEGDITEKEAVEKAVEGCGVVIHAAADTGPAPTKLGHYVRANIEAVEHVIEASLRHRVSRLIFVSTANVFGYGSKDRPADEKSPFTLHRSGSGYILSKFLAQQKVLEAVKVRHLPALVVNPTFMIGPHDTKPGSGRLILMVADKKIPLIPPGGKNLVPVRDVVKGIIHAIDKGRTGECYVLGNRNMTYKEIVELTARITSVKPTRAVLPGWMVKAAGFAGSCLGTISKRTIEMNAANAGILCLGMFYASAKAVRELNMPQSPVADAIREAYIWFQNNGYLHGQKH